MLLCTDLDLAQHEPALLRLCSLVATLVWQGSVSTSGTTATTSADLHSPPATAGMLFYFSAQNTCAVYLSSDSPNSHEISLVVPALTGRFPADPDDIAPTATYSSVTGQLWTFPQTRAASDAILGRLGLRALPDGSSFDADPLRNAAAYLALSMIFRSMAAQDRVAVTNSAGYSIYFNEHWTPLADSYQRRFEREISRIKVPVTVDAVTAVEDRSSLIPKRL